MVQKTSIYNKIILYLRRFLGISVRDVFQEGVIGTANFDQQHYFFVRQRKNIFLVADTKYRTYRQKISLPKELQAYVNSLRDVDALLDDKGHYHMVATITVGASDKTLYLHSYDGASFFVISMIKNPDSSPTKMYLHPDGTIYLFTSFDGTLFYRKLDITKRRITYIPLGVGPRTDSFDHAPLSVVGVFDVTEGIFVVYDSSYRLRGYSRLKLGGLLLDRNDSTHVRWRTYPDELPLWESFYSHKDSHVQFSFLRAFVKNDLILVYSYDTLTQNLHRLELHEPYARRNVHAHKAHLRKYTNNPIIRPNPEQDWEAHTTFNPAAIELEDTTYLLYRAEGTRGLSVLGHAKSKNGTHFTRLPYPVYVPRMHFEGVNLPDFKKMFPNGVYKSGYNHYPQQSEQEYEWHGVEDPRITRIDDRLYMIYAAYNGYVWARPAITSIRVDDFLKEKWNWSVPMPMTATPRFHGEGNKNVVLHPEKVKGKYMIYHRIWPHIRIDYVDDLEFGPNKKYLREVNRIPARGDSWDSHKVAVAAAPLRIDEGWLIIYQGAGSQDRRYKVGAMIVDAEDPARVLYRSNYPILVPDQWYETEHTFPVAFPCGAVVHNNMLRVYYGGSDKYVCMAEAPLRAFVEQLKQDPYQKPELHQYKHFHDLCI